MIKKIECPACHKNSVKVEVLANNYEVITTGRPLKEFNCQTRCSNCYRRIKYAVERKKNND